MQIPNIEKYKIILASQSPRRQQLLTDAGIKFDVVLNLSGDENFPKELVQEHIAIYLAKHKAKLFNGDLKENEILITADTIVWLKNEALNKPIDFNEAFSMLQKLSGNCHQVYTGVCIKSIYKELTFFSGTDVYFKKLTNEEIAYYIKNYKPYDKAGAYGIQEWIGFIAVEKINGSFFNVMGLPIQKLYTELNRFINK